MITNVEEFKQVIEGNYGITDLKSYDEYKRKKGPTGITKEEVELLSPDNVNSCSFWEYIEKNPEIAKDAVAFGLTKERSIDEVNQQNKCINAFDCHHINPKEKDVDICKLLSKIWGNKIEKENSIF